jgi:hypothetical protein
VLNNILNILIPIYSIVILGFVLGRSKFPWPTQPIVPLILKIGLPCLIVSHFSMHETVPPGMVGVLISATIILGVLLVAFYVFLRIFRLPLRTYLAAASLQNMAIGMALGFLAFGSVGFTLALGYASVILLGQFTLGYWVPGNRVDWRKSASQLAIYGIILGLVMMFLHIKPPSYIDRSLSLIGQLTIPLLLFSLGFSLANVKIERLPFNMLLSFVHLALCTGVGVATAFLMELKGEAFTVVVLLSILPSSTINLLMSRDSGADEGSMTVFVFSTNIFLVLSLPVALFLLLSP